MINDEHARVLIDAGMFIGALLQGDVRHTEARPLVIQARQGIVRACTTVGILSEVYGALTWEQAQPRQDPNVAAEAVLLLVESPSAITLLPETAAVVPRMLQLASRHRLTARRIHDARHAATALVHGVRDVYTYDPDDWAIFETEGMRIVGPPPRLYPASPHQNDTKSCTFFTLLADR